MGKTQTIGARVLDDYCRAHLPSYDRWRRKRDEIARQVRLEEMARRPEIWKLDEVAKVCGKRMRQWDKTNPSPLSSDARQRLEAEFREKSVAPGKN